VIFWSIGNEIGERFDPLGADTAKLLADWIRPLDTTRPITEGILSRPRKEQLDVFDRHCAALDIPGYNYAINSHREDHARVPSRVMVSTESIPGMCSVPGRGGGQLLCHRRFHVDGHRLSR